METDVKELIQAKLGNIGKLTPIEFTSQAGQNFNRNIDMAKLSFIFSEVGLDVFRQTYPQDKDSWVVMVLTLRALMNACVSYLERFYIEFIIEKMSEDTVKTKDDLKEYIHRNGLAYKEKRKRYISFQGMNEVKHYFKSLLNIDLDKFYQIHEIELLIDFRNVDVHNYGLFDNDFRNKYKHLLKGNENAIGHFTTGTSFIFNIVTLLTFVKYIDNH